MNSSPNKINDNRTIITLFESLSSLFTSLTCDDESLSLSSIQNKLKTSIKDGELCIQMINSLELFSTNESIDEIITENIRYLFTPVFLGYFHSQLNETTSRLDNLNKTQIYYQNFLRLIHNYNCFDSDNERKVVEKLLSKYEKRNDEDDKVETDLSFLRSRNEKIKRHKEQVKLRKYLKQHQEQVNLSHADDELTRQYYMKQCSFLINIIMDEMIYLQDEIVLLKRFGNSTDKRDSNTQAKTSSSVPSAPLTLFTITRSELEKKVFGLGYPSIPTYTVDEFMNNQIATGKIPFSQENGVNNTQRHQTDEEYQEEKAVRQDKEEETDNVDALKKKRDFDDFKDANPKGWGNTYNRS